MNKGEVFNPYKRFSGVWLPNAILMNTNLSLGAKVCYGLLCRYAGRDGRCYPSQTDLSEGLGVTDRQVRNLIKELEEQQFILVKTPESGDKFRHLNNQYIFLWHESFDGTPSPAEIDFRSGPEINFRSIVRESYKSKREESESKDSIESFNSASFGSNKVAPISGVLQHNPKDYIGTVPLIKRKNFRTIEFQVKPRQTHRQDVMDIIKYWNNSPGLSHHKFPSSTSEPTKTFFNIIATIRKVLDGGFFSSVGLTSHDRPYSKEEIILAIDRYKLAATNPSYLPSDKRGLNRLGLANFFYNPYSSYCSSQFLKYISEEPKLLANSVEKQEEKNPQFTLWLKEAYMEKVMMGESRKFTQLEENKFINGANQLHYTSRRLSGRLNLMTRPDEWCKIVVDALIDKWGRSQVYIGHLSSEFTYSDTLVRYLKVKGRLD